MVEPLRWGIIGTGKIAHTFTDEVSALDGHRVVAVASRTASRAAQFAGDNGIPIAHDSVTGLAADDDVDVVYVATPHPAHPDGALAAIAAGKPVLVEKPFAVTAADARRVADAAAAAGVFCMEAMWTRFLPHTRWVRQLLDAGAVGRVRQLAADYGERFEPDPEHRLYSPALGGGALLDLGIYPLHWAFLMLGHPSGVSATSVPAMTGVDAQTVVTLHYPDGAQAVLSTTLEVDTPTRAWLGGERGTIDVSPPFHSPTSATLTLADGRSQRFDPPALPGPGKGLRFMAIEVARCVRAKLTESPILPMAETIAVLEVVDEIHRQIGRPGAR